ncbi:SGNH hydrolase domain-containing protein [Nocardioides dilutus]
MRLVVLLLLALLASGCSGDPGPPPGPKQPRAEETHGGGTASADPPPPASSESQVLERVRRAVEAARAGDPIPEATAPSVQELKQDYARGGACPAFYRSDGDWRLCARGDPDGERTLVVIGDSHARQWGSPLDILAEREGYTAYHLVRLGCPAADLTPWLNKRDGPNVVCERFHAWTVEQVRALQPDVVVLATSFNPNGYVVDGAQVLDESERLLLLRDGMARLAAMLEPDVGRFVVIGDPPAVQLSPVKCLLRAKTLDRCAAPGSALSLQANDAVRGAAQDAAAKYVSTAEWFCLDNYCPTVLGELLSYRDQNHVSDTYARYLTEVLGAELALGT